MGFFFSRNGLENPYSSKLDYSMMDQPTVCYYSSRLNYCVIRSSVCWTGISQISEQLSASRSQFALTSVAKRPDVGKCVVRRDVNKTIAACTYVRVLLTAVYQSGTKQFHSNRRINVLKQNEQVPVEVQEQVIPSHSRTQQMQSKQV